MVFQHRRCTAAVVTAALASTAVAFTGAPASAAHSTASSLYSCRSSSRANIRPRTTALRVLSEASPPTVEAPAASSTELTAGDVQAELQARGAAVKPLRVAKAANLVIESDTLADEPYMIAIVGATVLLATVMMGSAVVGMAAAANPAASVAASALAFSGGVLFADAFTGVFHCVLFECNSAISCASNKTYQRFNTFKMSVNAHILFSSVCRCAVSIELRFAEQQAATSSVDNYGGLHTPVFGTVIEAFQGHHGSPWTITYRKFANNVHK
eukprot:21048-Heterococcus_DN1.PRE.1